ncbi:RNA polymerase sigma factor [Haliscomenobacter hydrossis]|uniref:RNA polymerase, sigma-24 subunit, ECF subfamily n=1 Tax=Haliscomenobacter hydrossis (strain ATCC 27775 / DSM 1100 / LMG 10767 / O) TaxID=760192 RepID=F4KUD9_HALH1|nr:sigma-70 family RNA polymerase sigma factor [Haliscomenobacter hydrossis]AEE51221.1 RNA polymerase, sigma-24 subunit, ECF subfamily [Haliscomenobacter hydrossis DSM 1100]
MEQQTEILLRKAREGDQHALNLLFRTWYRRAHQMAMRYVSDEHMAREAVQHAFMSVYQHLDQLQQSEKFVSWLYRTVINCCHMEGRKKQRSRLIELNLAEAHQPRAQMADRDLQLAERNRLLMDAVERLPEDQRTIVILKELDGMKFREIADLLQISENTAKSRLYVGLKNLKQILTQQRLIKEMYYEE